ncbi:hypothetical protein SEA_VALENTINIPUFF_66 [Microbacterium phage ValentiniPuff]|uniref:Uncharacterized protein n=1 Tax=Microbacterium phage ValentiniPuff TaxID=2315705 RepID=A0A386KS97_9CAUD|nr:hypothetical protein SEA_VALENTINIPUFF_66 [Microbacterium phage ValentiniPuff]
MTDSTGAAFGVTAPAPLEVNPAALQQPVQATATVTEAPAVSAVPAAARERLTDRLHKRQVREKLVDIGDGDQVLVRGMDAYAIESLNAGDDDSIDEDSKPKITEQQPRMLRAMCFDPIDGSKLFGTGEQIGVDPKTDQPIIDGWTDHQINKLPMDVLNPLMSGVNYVMGRGTEPGKDSPSTPDTASSSS